VDLAATAALAISDLLAIQSDLWQNGKRASYGLFPDRAETIANLLSAALSTIHVLSLLEAAVLQDEDEELANLASLAHSLAESIMVERAGDLTTHP